MSEMVGLGVIGELLRLMGVRDPRRWLRRPFPGWALNDMGDEFDAIEWEWPPRYVPDALEEVFPS